MRTRIVGAKRKILRAKHTRASLGQAGHAPRSCGLNPRLARGAILSEAAAVPTPRAYYPAASPRVNPSLLLGIAAVLTNSQTPEMITHPAFALPLPSCHWIGSVDGGCAGLGSSWWHFRPCPLPRRYSGSGVPAHPPGGHCLVCWSYFYQECLVLFTIVPCTLFHSTAGARSRLGGARQPGR